MNKNINSISEEAAEYASSRIDDSDEDWSFRFDRDYDEKFAELIIKECLDEIESYKIPVGNSPVGELAAEWTIEALLQIRDSIKEKFEMTNENN